MADMDDLFGEPEDKPPSRIPRRIDDDMPPPIIWEDYVEGLARKAAVFEKDETGMLCFRHLFDQAMKHDTSNMRAVAGLLLNSYDRDIPGTGFPAERMRHLDVPNRGAVLGYLRWLGGAGGRYPPKDDMVQLKARWDKLKWGRPRKSRGSDD